MTIVNETHKRERLSPVVGTKLQATVGLPHWVKGRTRIIDHKITDQIFNM